MLNLCIVRVWITYLIVFLLTLSALSASAQSSGWDASLDRYESICNQCIDLRQRSLAGEAVSSASITDLLGQLASLRRALQASAGPMTPSQRARFESIRLRYSEAFSSPSPARSSSFRPAIPSLSDLPSMSPSGPASIGRTISLSPRGFPAPSGILLSDNDSPRSADVRFGIIAFAAMPVARPGIMARLDLGRAGLYAKGSLRPSEASSFDCLSDGTTATGFIWTSGRESSGAMSVSAGLSYALLTSHGSGTVSDHGPASAFPASSGPGTLSLRLYAGAGYGGRTVLWEDASGRWARVSDLSPSGLCADAGLLLDYGHLSLMAGLSTISFQTLGFELGLGLLL